MIYERIESGLILSQIATAPGHAEFLTFQEQGGRDSGALLQALGDELAEYLHVNGKEFGLNPRPAPDDEESSTGA